MKFLQHGLLFISLLLLLPPVLTSPAPTRTSKSGSSANWEVFNRLLDTLDDTSIHSILHAISPKFQHGVFSKDRSAIEQIHSENPPLASSLIFIAKRQSNSTAVITTTTSTSTLASAASVVESVLSSEITATTLPPPTTVGLSPSTPVGAVAIATTNGAVIFSSTKGGGLVTVASSTAFITFSRESSAVLSTYTLPNGHLTTATSIVVINAPITGSVKGAGTGTAATPGASAGLQSGAARATSGYLLEMAALVGGAALVALAL